MEQNAEEKDYIYVYTQGFEGSLRFALNLGPWRGLCDGVVVVDVVFCRGNGVALFASWRVTLLFRHVVA